MRKKADPKSFIEDTLAQHGHAGFFSHAFFECGLLSDKEPFFRTSWQNDQRKIFDLASLTKALVTAPLVFWLAEKKGFSLKQSVKDWLGSTQVSLPKPILNLSIEELLQHKSGLPAWRNLYVNRLNEHSEAGVLKANAQAVIEEFFARENLVLLEKKDRYSDLGFILLGYVLEKVSGEDLSTLFSSFLHDVSIDPPSSLGFFDAFSSRNFIPSSYCEVRRRVLSGEVHDENAATLGGFAGHAGLFSSGEALSSFLKNFSRSVFGNKFICANAEAAIQKEDSSLLGWRHANESEFPFGAKKAIGHYGFVGTSFWINPENNSYVIFLTNRVISGRVSTQIKPLRLAIFTAAEEICRTSRM